VAARRIDDHGIGALLRRPLDALPRSLDGVLPLFRVDGDLDLAAELLELVDRGRALEVGRDECRRPPVLAEHQRQLGGRGRLPRALQPREQDHRRAALGEGEPRVGAAHRRGQLLVDDLHHLVTRRQALRHLLADRTLLHAGDEVLDHLQVDVGLEQRETDLAHGLRDRFLVKPSASAKVAEGVLKLVGKRVEHGRTVYVRLASNSRIALRATQSDSLLLGLGRKRRALGTDVPAAARDP
jgi:hypothetical protein